MSPGQIQARNLLVSSQVLLHELLRGSSAFVSPSLVKDRVCSVLNRAFVGFRRIRQIIPVHPMDGGCSSWTDVCPLAGHNIAASSEVPSSRSPAWLGHQCGHANTPRTALGKWPWWAWWEDESFSGLIWFTVLEVNEGNSFLAGPWALVVGGKVKDAEEALPEPFLLL